MAGYLGDSGTGANGVPSPVPVPINVLILEDNPDDAELALAELRGAGFNPIWQRVEKESEFAEALIQPFDLILSDYGLPGYDGLAALDWVRTHNLDVPFILVSGSIGEDLAVEALQRGAWDYLLKDRMARLGPAAHRALEQREIRAEQKRAEMALQTSEARYRDLFDDAPVMYVVTERIGDEFIVTNCNELVLQTLDYAREEIIGRPLREFIPMDNRAEIPLVHQRAQDEQQLEIEHPLLARDGRIIETLIRLRAEPTSSAEFSETRATLIDITKRNQAERARKAAEAKYRGLVEQIPAVVYTDLRGETSQTLFVSPQIESLLGYSVAEYLADSELWERSLHPDDRTRVLDTMNKSTMSGTPFQTEYRLITRDGRVVWVRDEAKPANDPGGEVPTWQGILIDITQRKELEGQLHHQAFHDALTGLPNRELVLDRLSHARARSGRLGTCIAVLILDLDNFKVINDGLGHGGGDQLLVSVGKRLCLSVRDGDTVARLGGDEFICVLEDLNGQSEAEATAARIADRLLEPILIDGRQIIVTASIGIAVSGIPFEESETLLRHADQAMYMAKHTGKARAATFDPTMNAGAWNRLEIESDLRQAIEGGELLLVYQPIVDLTSGAVREVEALVRWKHPVRGLISPSEFVPIAEETGLIIRLGRWVLEEACQSATTWPSTAAVAVNLSARQFDHPELVNDVALILSRTGLPAARLQLEITERVALVDDATTRRTLDALSDLGVGLAVDDFGTGYSGLGTLKDSKVSTLKVDRSFVAGLGIDDRDTAIVRAVLAFAGALGLTTIGEGVETAAQAVALRELGCELAQGHLFARPLPVSDLLEFLRKSVAERGVLALIR